MEKLMDPRTATGRGALINAISRTIGGEIPMGDAFISAVISRIVGSHRGVGGVVKDIRTDVISRMDEVKDSQRMKMTIMFSKSSRHPEKDGSRSMAYQFMIGMILLKLGLKS
jgi:hypothetical protein